MAQQAASFKHLTGLIFTLYFHHGKNMKLEGGGNPQVPVPSLCCNQHSSVEQTCWWKVLA